MDLRPGRIAFVLLASCALLPATAPAATYFVCVDGGPPDRCTGLANAPAPSGGSSQACAWDHPYRALPPGGPARISGGDTLVVGPGSYMMGFGAPGAEACSADGSWGCYAAAVPSGPDASHPTRVLGSGWDSGCASPPELWGTERSEMVLNLTGTSHAEVGCFAVTDHSGCVEFHSGSIPCPREAPPYGPWAQRGIYAVDSSGVFLHHLNIHGLAAAGILAGRLRDWRVEDVRIVGNGMVGWDGDVEGDDSNSGSLAFRRFRVEWNGCGETWPGGQPTGCWAQSAGGYGDGFGTGATAGTWLFEDSTFLRNTSDGLDLLYARTGSSITLRRVHSEGNAGDQVKTNGPVTIENTVAVSSCGGFEGQPYTHNVDPCRAGGSALFLVLREGARAQVVNSTIAGEGDGLVTGECDTTHSSCNGQERIFLRNNVYVGGTDFFDPGDVPSLIYQETFPQGNQVWDVDYSVARHVKGACPGTHNSCGEAPAGLFNEAIDTFDAHLLPTSPARDAGSPSAAPSVDFDNLPRDARPDVGAYEYRASGGPCTLSCTAAGPANAIVGTAVAFQATATLSGCAGGATYAWSFGDGAAGSSLQNPSHAYSSAGVFPFTLTVSADGQACTRSGSVTVSAAPPPPRYVYVVPAVTHAPGLLGTTWRSDVAAVNLGGAAASLTFTFVPASGDTLTRPATLSSSGIREFADVLSSLFGFAASASSSGALQVASDQPLLIASRTFNLGTAGTYGGYIPAVAASSGGVVQGQTGYLPQLRKGPSYRTNVGVTNLGAATANVAIRLRGAGGSPVGSETLLTVPAGGFLQATDIFATSGAGDQEIAYATVEVRTPGGRFWAYASVIDNATGDPTIVPLTLP
jgi:PKD repeat protein